VVAPTSACFASVRFFLSRPRIASEHSCGRPAASLGQIEPKFHHKNALIWHYQRAENLARKRIFEREKMIFVNFPHCL
jgi:hypothetical protein